jgi:hypothetical protein
MLLFVILLCPHLGRFENYFCMENYNIIFTLKARTLLWWNTYISVDELLMRCKHCLSNILSKYCFVIE